MHEEGDVMKRAFIALVMACLLTVFLASQALCVWYPTCQVVQAGTLASDGTIYVVLTSSGWTGNRTVTIQNGSAANSILAVALSAIAAGKSVAASISGSTINSMYMNNE